METPETQGVSIDHRCWDCGYDLRGLEAEAPCPECGADRGEQIKQRRAMFVRESVPYVWIAGAGTVLCCLALWFLLMTGSADFGWNLVLVCAPPMNLLVGFAFLNRCERGIRRVVGVILVRAVAWANASFTVGALIIFLSWPAMIPIPIAGCVTILSCIWFIVRWGMFADRAYLPARGNLGGVQLATVVTLLITGMWPAWYVMFWRVFSLGP